jgi:hypothetical protein
MTDGHHFEQLPVTPANHFRLHFYAAVSQLVAAAAPRVSTSDAIAECVDALSGYQEELRPCGVLHVDAAQVPAWWRNTISAWETGARTFLPARELRDAIGTDLETMSIVFMAGLIEEDARFGALFERLNAAHGQSGQPRATVSVLAECWRDGDGPDVRASLRMLAERGLVHVVNSDAPRAQHGIAVPPAVWDALRGERHERPAAWLRYVPPDALPAATEPILPPSLARALTNVPRLMAAGDVQTIVVRGPLHNGRRTLLGAIARASGRGLLEVTPLDRPDAQAHDDRWRQVALLATAMQAMPVLACDPGPGERVELHRPGWFTGPIGVAIGRSGGISGAAAERAITLSLDMPGLAERRAHWGRALGGADAHSADADAIAERFRLPSGHITRAATLARARAALAGRSSIAIEDVCEATRLLNAQALDALAARVSCAGDWTDLAAREDTIRDLVDLELRCRQRERLPSALGRSDAASCGVRALFRGPSGTGKTLAARLLASVLQKDLYRVDLSSIINKYIGETEKNLDRVISRAEELDVILLFDEGDALLTQRTGVSNANDRYANLETNFLLQRLEAFDGILVVTTNAGERIDAAFERRMDVIVEFQPAQPAERWALWQLHLPPNHVVPPDFLDELASRCVLNGGQIRNVVQHAVLQGLPRDGALDAALLEAAVRREYRKAGAVCPLRSIAPACSA